ATASRWSLEASAAPSIVCMFIWSSSSPEPPTCARPLGYALLGIQCLLGVI
ncbi:hypothetical protein BBP40_010822, partial [Aspergillus hancockii]